METVTKEILLDYIESRISLGDGFYLELPNNVVNDAITYDCNYESGYDSILELGYSPCECWCQTGKNGYFLQHLGLYQSIIFEHSYLPKVSIGKYERDKKGWITCHVFGLVG